MITLFIILAVILAIYLAFKFAKKLVKFILIVFFLLVGGAAYVYFGTDYFADSKTKELGKNISAQNLLKVYCKPDMRATDKLKCDCIVRPLHSDLTNRLSPQDLKDLEGHKLLFMKELLISYKNKRGEIKAKLKENGASELFEQFKADIKSGELFKDFSDLKEKR